MKSLNSVLDYFFLSNKDRRTICVLGATRRHTHFLGLQFILPFCYQIVHLTVQAELKAGTVTCTVFSKKKKNQASLIFILLFFSISGHTCAVKSHPYSQVFLCSSTSSLSSDTSVTWLLFWVHILPHTLNTARLLTWQSFAFTTVTLLASTFISLLWRINLIRKYICSTSIMLFIYSFHHLASSFVLFVAAVCLFLFIYLLHWFLIRYSSPRLSHSHSIP